MIRVKFDTAHKVQQHDGNGPLYEKGKTYSFSGFTAETYARKYIARGYGHQVNEDDATLSAARAEEADRDLAEATRKAEEAAKFAERSAVDIPDNIDGLSWPALRALATKLTDETIHGKADALAAIQAERGRRAIAD